MAYFNPHHKSAILTRTSPANSANIMYGIGMKSAGKY